MPGTRVWEVSGQRLSGTYTRPADAALAVIAAGPQPTV